MKNFEFESADICTKVLVIKQKGKISAIGNKCSHYGAFLSMGVLGDGRVRCPWHGACFNIETGDIEDYPGQDSIPCYQVKIESGMVKVRAKKSALQSSKRTPEHVARDLTSLQTFVIIGGGPSGAICVEKLRQNFGGKIVLICRENYLPYDRVKVSKSMDSDIKSILLRNEEFYDEHDIEVMLGISATSLSLGSKEVSLSNGEKLKYDKVYIATGSSPATLNVPGMNLKNISTLRDISESYQIMKKINKNSHVVVIGVSFTGMEAASFLVKKVAKITVIGRDSVPFRHSFGPEIGEAIMNMFVNENITFEMKNGIKKCIGNQKGEIERIELNDGKVLQADILIVACGSVLNTAFLSDSGLVINKDGSIDTNEYLETTVNSDVYIGGDIANSPILMTGKRENIGHYPLAQYHGKIAALNMCGIKTELKAVPFFWTMLFGKSFRYAGHGKPSEIKIIGSLETFKFVAYYINEEEQVIAASSCGHDPIVAQFAEFLSQGKILQKSDIENDPFGWTKRINEEREI
ncbi:apoptosis-inducing factor 3-like isoform X2 [Chironomus tepperi]